MSDVELPHGWAQTEISEILVPQITGKPFQQGWSPQCLPQPAEDGAWGVLKTTAIQESEFWPHQNKALPASLDPKPNIEIKPGDVLMTCAGPRNRCGVACYVKEVRPGLMMSGKMYRFRPDGRAVEAMYLMHFLTAHDSQVKIDRMKTGINDSGLNLTHDRFSAFPIIVPPLPEQKRIVAKIEELFTKLDKGIESLRDAQAQLKLYRQASIDFALRNTEGVELISTCLGDVIGPMDQGWSPKCDYNLQPEPDQWAVITTTAVQPQRYLPNECKPLPAGLKPRQKIEVQQGDILMTRKGPRKRTGIVCRVREHRARSMLCDTVYRFRAKENIICPDFLEILLNSPSVLAQIDKLKAGISDSGISLNQGKVKSVKLTIPHKIEEQRQIYARVQMVEESIVRIEAEIETQLAKADALRQSILKQAFSGKLVPQDPDDEPASVLLERIRAERAGAKPPKRQTRPRKAKEAA